MKYILLIIALLTTGCGGNEVVRCEPVTVTEYSYRIPVIPPEFLSRSMPPHITNWNGKTQRDVGLYIIDLHKTVDRGNAKLISIEEFMATLKRRQEESKSGEVNNGTN